MIASRSLAFVWGDGKVARVGWKIARVSSAISPHASAITPRSATFARHARQLRRPPRSSSGWKNSFGDMASGFLDVSGDFFT
jgi:hypothetical protein